MFWPHRNPERQASAHVLELALEYDHEAFEVHCSLCVDRVLGLEQSVLIVTVRLHNCYTCRRGSNCECVRAVLCFRSCSCVCIYIYTDVCLCVRAWTCLCVCVRRCVYIVYMYVCMCIVSFLLSVCSRVSAGGCPCVPVSMRLTVCVCARARMCEHVCVCVCLYVSVHVCVCVCLSVCMQVSVCVCLHVRASVGLCP